MRLGLALSILASAAVSSAQSAATQSLPELTLHVGDPAPPIVVEKWLKGVPVTQYFSSEAYVVVFWATWCNAFLPVIPHLTELQIAYNGKAQIIAVSVFESRQARAIDYVNQMADKMKFQVAMDKVPSDSKHGMDGAMVVSWLKPSQQLGIPMAFIVDKEGKIAWIGTPVGNQIDEPLRKIVNGSWDSSAFAQKYNSDLDRQKAINDITQQIASAVEANDWDTALKHSDELTPFDKGAAASARYLVLLRKGDFPGAYSFASQLAEGPLNSDATALYSLAWLTVNPQAHWDKSDYDLGLKLAKRSVELSGRKNADMLDTLAWAYFGKKDRGNAVSTENDALAVARDDQKYKLQQNLATFKKGS